MIIFWQVLKTVSSTSGTWSMPSWSASWITIWKTFQFIPSAFIQIKADSVRPPKTLFIFGEFKLQKKSFVKYTFSIFIFVSVYIYSKKCTTNKAHKTTHMVLIGFLVYWLFGCLVDLKYICVCVVLILSICQYLIFI